MEEEYDHLDRQVKSISNVDDTYASAPSQLDGCKVSWWASENKKNSLPRKVYEQGLNREGGDIYAVVKKVRHPISNAAAENGNDDSNVNPEQTSSSSVQQVQAKPCDKEKRRLPKLVFAIIVTVLALTGMLTGVVALIKLSNRTSQMETQKLTTRINELEEQVERCSVRTDALENIMKNNSARTDQLQDEMERNNARTVDLEEYLESNITNLNNSIQVIDEMVEKLWNKTSELEENIIGLHGLFIFNGTGYMLTEEAKNWTESRRRCQEQGGDLAAAGIRDPNTRSKVGDALLQESSDAWIGLDDKKIDRQFIWVDGVNSTKENTPWHNKEPNNAGGDEDCVDIKKTNLTLYDDSCTKKKQGICEISWLT